MFKQYSCMFQLCHCLLQYPCTFTLLLYVPTISLHVPIVLACSNNIHACYKNDSFIFPVFLHVSMIFLSVLTFLHVSTISLHVSFCYCMLQQYSCMFLSLLYVPTIFLTVLNIIPSYSHCYCMFQHFS